MPKREPAFILNWKNDFVACHVREDRVVSWHEVFGNTHPLDLEIGIGNGSFLAPFAAAHPDRNIVGIELESLYLRKADHKLVTGGMTNGRLLVGDAKLLLWKLFADGSIADVYVNYPDPWFKKRHKKRRLINETSLRMMARKMTGTLTIATDDPEYRDFVLESSRSLSCLRTVFDNGYAGSLPGYVETKYERKWKDQGKPVFYMQFQKMCTPEVDIDDYIETHNLRFSLGRILEKSNQTLEAV